MNEPRLTLHPDAASHFNADAAELVGLVVPYEPAELSPALEPDFHVAATITEKDIIGDVDLSKVDGLGREVSKFFRHEGRYYGLMQEPYQRMLRLVEKIQGARTLRACISKETVKDHLFEWISLRFRNQVSEPMVDFVLPRCEATMDEWEIWVPVSWLVLPADLPLGKVVFKTVHRETFDEWERQLSATRTPEPAEVTYYERQRRRLQGFAAGVLVMVGDPKRAEEMAIEETERGVALLRFFSPASLIPEARCYCRLAGQASSPTATVLRLRRGTVEQWSERPRPAGQRSWIIAPLELADFKRLALDRLHRLLATEKPTPLESDVLESFLLFSRVSIAEELADKLVFLLAALEGLFLKDSGEPVQQNLAERMALAVGQNLEHRKRIIAHVKAAYGLRSNFLHHAQRIEDLGVMTEFMLDGWLALQAALGAADTFQTRKQFLDRVDDAKLS